MPSNAYEAKGRRISGGDDGRKETFQAMVDAAVFRLDPRAGLHPGARDFATWTMAELADQCLRWSGVTPPGGLNPLFSSALAMVPGLRAYGDVDFPTLLRARFSKLALHGFDASPTTYQRLAAVNVVPDLRPVDRGAVAGLDTLREITQATEAKSPSMVARTETNQAKLYGECLGFTRQALINDDQKVLSVGPVQAGAAAARTINKLFYDLLLSASGLGPTLNQDSKTLFHADHNNYVSSGAAPTASTLSALRTKMRTQAEPVSGRALNIPAKYLVVPPQLETEARVLVAAEHSPDADDNLEVVVDAALAAGTNGTTAWYLFADPAKFDTIEIVTGNPGGKPSVEQATPRTDFDGVEFIISLMAGAGALEFRTMARNRGA